MELRIYTFPEYLEILKKDYDDLKKEREKLCKLEESFLKTDQISNEVQYAITHYGKEEMENHYVRIEVTRQYYEKTDAVRKIMLLHELIHACQRSNELLNWNKKIRGILAIFYGKITRYYLTDDYEKIKLEEMWKNFNWIKSWFFTLPFEIWDDIFFRDTFPELFSLDVEIIHQNISEGVDTMDLKNAVKYPVFVQLVRSTYLEKITKGADIATKFSKLSGFWRSKLNDIIKEDEQDFFDSSLESLSNISNYPDPSELEKIYEEFAIRWWKDEIGT